MTLSQLNRGGAFVVEALTEHHGPKFWSDFEIGGCASGQPIFHGAQAARHRR
jgi:hypothetical protein